MGSLILAGNPPGNLPVSRWAILSGNYLNNLSHRFIHLSNFLKKFDSCSASGGGCTLCLGVHLQLSPVNLAQKKKFSPPWGCTYTPWLRLCRINHCANCTMGGSPAAKGPDQLPIFTMLF